ncbi:MAG: thiosulfate oxidation carrier complex protein SoxZ [Betaproteobacteria bacterium]|nr:thiosulfate oxidation carrier complex protein SoxZ [Betaproteobacteria bacterium]
MARVQLPGQARKGEVVAVRLLIQHGMETGHRQDDVGRFIERNVIQHVSCRYNGVEVFRAELSSGISANPYLQFYIVAEASGELVFTWVDDKGETGEARQSIAVTG